MGHGGNTHNLENAPSKKMVCKLQKKKKQKKKRSPQAEKGQLFRAQIQNSLTGVLL